MEWPESLSSLSSLPAKNVCFKRLCELKCSNQIINVFKQANVIQISNAETSNSGDCAAICRPG